VISKKSSPPNIKEKSGFSAQIISDLPEFISSEGQVPPSVSYKYGRQN